MTPMLAALAAAGLGPLTLAVARRRMNNPWTPGRIEIVAIASVAGVTAATVLHGPPPASVLLPLMLLGPAAAIVDAYEGRLPDLLTAPLLATTLIAAALSGPDGVRGIIAAAALSAIAATTAVLVTDVLGWGDVKLVPTVVIVLADRDALLVGLVHILVLVGVTAAVVSVLKDRRAVVPYGPAIVFGTLGAVAGL